MKRILYVLIIIAIIIIGFVSYCFFNNSIPQKNFRNFSSNSYFVYTDIQYKNVKTKIIIDNNSLYNFLREEKRINKFTYILKMNFNACLNSALKVNENDYNKLVDYIVNEKDIMYKNQLDSINNIANEEYLDPNIDSKKKNMLIYILLNKNIKNCYIDCESGYILLIDPSK